MRSSDAGWTRLVGNRDQETPQERLLSRQEKSLFDLLMTSVSTGNLCMTVVRVRNEERAVIAAKTVVNGENGLIPIALVVRPQDLQRMTIGGTAPMDVAVDIRDGYAEQVPTDPTDLN